MAVVDGITLDYIDVARFWRGVAVGGKDDCWLWEKHRKAFGYGELKISGRHLKAHRAAFAIAMGIDPADAVVRHTCDNPACCNPLHLVLGTTADNVADRVTRNRSAVGERNGRSKLTTDEARYIFQSTEPVSKLARDYDVDRKVITDIRNRITWKTATADL